MSEPTLYGPSAKRIVELQDEIDQLKAIIAELQPKADAYPRLVALLHDIDRGMRHQDAAMKSHHLPRGTGMTNEQALKAGYDCGQVDRDNGEDESDDAWKTFNLAMTDAEHLVTEAGQLLKELGELK